MVYGEPSRVAVEAVAVYPRVSHGVFTSRTDEPNGSSEIEPGAEGAIVHYLDVPLLGSLLFSNTRTGRAIDVRVGGVEFLASEPPPSSAVSFSALAANTMTDEHGTFYQSLRSLGRSGLRLDGSARVALPSGTPISLVLTSADGTPLAFPEGGPFTGVMRQRESMQFYPGERTKQALRRDLFNGLCAGCHGSISGRELDVHVAVDVLTGASKTDASDELHDLR
jgi:hypothetical protein